MRYLACALLLALMSGCAVKQVKPLAVPLKKPTGIKLVAEERFMLESVTPDALHEFHDYVLRSAQTAATVMGGDKAVKSGFNYKVEPVGAIEPFSEVRVSCMMKAEAVEENAQTCDNFFELIGSQYQVK
jgi:hypothetical protein